MVLAFNGTQTRVGEPDTICAMDLNFRHPKSRELNQHLNTIGRNVLADKLFKYFKQTVFVVLGLRRLAPSILCPDTLEELIDVAKRVIEKLQEDTNEETALSKHFKILQEALCELDDIKVNKSNVFSSYPH